ncbi:histidine phosphatase family protein [Bacillus carboniphilus]|uniref:Histidine phosphatase family protein n=1 Tax=Bacillus carboniphilus TaxID=86663 RepID=A0ABY9JTD5_9BACI|nr:histidine phosphatase family protein [Bacillus carboniphilus]WLR42089.1 histidine phosphatase family protein [Bacillus carboniphilus]
MNTYLYLVRHGDSPKEGNERIRGLSEKGKRDALKVKDILIDEGIDVFVSSPYKRAILTIQPLANETGQGVKVHEDLMRLFKKP